MTRKEFCELMAAGHENAKQNFLEIANRNENEGRYDNVLRFATAAAEQDALARAFRDLAKEQDQ